MAEFRNSEAIVHEFLVEARV